MLGYTKWGGLVWGQKSDIASLRIFFCVLAVGGLCTVQWGKQILGHNLDGISLGITYIRCGPMTVAMANSISIFLYTPTCETFSDFDVSILWNEKNKQKTPVCKFQW